MKQDSEDTRDCIKKWNLYFSKHKWVLVYNFLLALVRIPWHNLDIDPRQSGQTRLNLSSDMLGTLERTTALM